MSVSRQKQGKGPGIRIPLAIAIKFVMNQIEILRPGRMALRRPFRHRRRKSSRRSGHRVRVNRHPRAFAALGLLLALACGSFAPPRLDLSLSSCYLNGQLCIENDQRHSPLTPLFPARRQKQRAGECSARVRQPRFIRPSLPFSFVCFPVFSQEYPSVHRVHAQPSEQRKNQEICRP